MVATTIVTVLCAAGIAFYVRFMVALGKECKPGVSGYWVRLRLDRGDGGEWVELQTRKRPTTRAA
jgi:hypothetical protein